ncbi:MAG: hypothetical protein ACREIP_15075 [Alphaproteobacteria bacterium]
MMKFAHFALAPALALAGLAAAAAPSLAQGYGYQNPGYGYQSPGYTYTRPPYAYQPPPYSYQSPNYTYQPPSYTYTPPGYYRPHAPSNTPDYNQAYPTPPSAYDEQRAERRWRRRYRDPIYNRFGNPRNPTDVWNSAPPYQSESESR